MAGRNRKYVATLRTLLEYFHVSPQWEATGDQTDGCKGFPDWLADALHSSVYTNLIGPSLTWSFVIGLEAKPVESRSALRMEF